MIGFIQLLFEQPVLVVPVFFIGYGTIWLFIKYDEQ